MSHISHLEIAGTDGSALAQFYAELFGWRIRRRDAGGFEYYDVEGATAGPASMGIRHEPQGRAELVIYVSVANVDEAVERACALGAAIRISPMSHGDLRFALLEDPQGNPLGVTEALPG